MSAITQPSISRYSLAICLDGSISVAATLLDRLQALGVLIHSWTICSAKSHGLLDLRIDLSGNPNDVNHAILGCPLVTDCDFLDADSSHSIELAVVAVSATGDAQDQAASSLAAAGARLLSIDNDGFVAHLSEHPEKINRVLSEVKLLGDASVTRSGGLTVRRF